MASAVDLRGLAFDVLAVLVFVAAGRMQHHGADAFQSWGFPEAVWPFLAGLAVGLLVAASAPGAYRSLPAGAGVVGATVVCGLALRYASGQGLALSFAVVTLVVLGILMLGWRVAAARLT